MTTTFVTLLYDWTYEMYGKRWKRNYEYPRSMTGRSRHRFSYDASASWDEQINKIKKQMKDDIIHHYRERLMEQFYSAEGDEEEIDYEKFQFYNIREATKWSDLEDFDSSR